MGNSRGSRSRIVADDTVWASEAEGEDAVLAEFADETVLAQTGPTPERSERPRRGWRLLNPHTPMKEIVRIVLVGCLSAMALGASFAIGFGYVWSDLAVITPPADTTSPAAAPPTRDRSPLPSPEASRDHTVPTSAPESAVRPTEETRPPVTELREPPIVPEVPPAKSPDRPDSASATNPTAADPGPAFGVPVQHAASNSGSAAEVSGSLPSVSNEKALLVSQPMLSAESATIAESVSPSSPSLSRAPISARSAETGESALSAAHRADLEAVQQAIERYQVAYSQKDVGAMALVWPSVDVAGVARAFENVDRQALTFDDCRVTTAGNLATAVCPGQVRYVGRVGGRHLQERQGTWTIALERNGQAWQFTRLNVR